MSNFSGTWQLIKLALRRDRIKLTIWVLLLIIINIAMISSLQVAYGQPDQRAIYAMSMESSAIGRMFGGILDGSSLGAITMVEVYVFTALFIGFMSAQTLVRHTRFNEEMGSTELIQSAQTGRYAALTAALVVVFLANLLIFFGSAIGASLQGILPVAGLWLMFGSLALTGMSFAAATAICVQLAQTSRGANMLAVGVVIVSLIIRAIGDAMAPAATIGQQVNSTWLSWLSPIGWGQQIYPFTRKETWTLAIPVIFIIITTAIAYKLLSRRDVGAGILQSKMGRDRASNWLTKNVGLAWRLTRISIIAWMVLTSLLGAMYGYIGNQFKELLTSSDMIKSYLAAGNDEQSLMNAYYGAMISMSVLMIVGMIIQVMQRLRTEEASGFLENILSTTKSRLCWVTSYIGLIFTGTVVLLILFTLAFGIALKISTGTDWGVLIDIGKASAVYLPTLTVFIGIAVATFGLAPSALIPIGWSYFAASFIIGQFGALFKFPQYIINLTPFSHVPDLMTASFSWLPIVLLSAVALFLNLIGIISFLRRDITTK